MSARHGAAGASSHTAGAAPSASDPYQLPPQSFYWLWDQLDPLMNHADTRINDSLPLLVLSPFFFFAYPLFTSYAILCHAILPTPLACSWMLATKCEHEECECRSPEQKNRAPRPQTPAQTPVLYVDCIVAYRSPSLMHVFVVLL